MKTEQTTINFIPDLRNVNRLEVAGKIISRAAWSAEDSRESDSHPLNLVNPEDWPSNANRFYCFWVEDCFSPPVYLVAVEVFGDHDDGFGDAYEVFQDFAADHCHLKIEEPDLKDYLDESGEYTGNYTSDGQPIDTEAIRGERVSIVRIDCQHA